ncbi:restriction endonuclease subunit M [Moraxella sp. FZLJ2107]|uniref:restriction endonuclease subunit M n=1 Tax=unclassified Moraxella TaxID=2685852 RepID=UPI0020C90273|nr:MULTISPECIES: restriction endonuclease subunit M [unclassified Moraxella]UTO04275.1 restriction endonuclease subunit M [Moraxella sp. FZLJ2107]UTO23108.1 restriction endonuclease subunit M [Moraxella sp. FZLJ2109]
MTDTAKTQSQTKSKKRVADHGEVFTHEREVRAMLDLVKIQSQQIGSRFLEPACGTGNFLAEILTRKLTTVLAKSQINKSQKSPKYSQSHYERDAIWAISSIYGIELLADNVSECRSRLLSLFESHYRTHFGNINQAVIGVAQFLLSKNIVHGDALTLKDHDGDAIVFSEWAFVSDIKLNRRDFVYENLVEKIDNQSPVDKGFIAKPIQEYPPIHFLNLFEQG